MKLYLLAAAAMIAVPAFAQDTTAQDPAAQSMPQGQTADPSMQTPTPPATDPAMGAPATDPAMGAQTTSPSMGAPATDPSMTAPASPGASTMADPNAPAPAGGYQPSQPPMQGQAAPGQQVRFQPAPSPDQAYPAPAPKASYPICKKGQYDGCTQASDSHRSTKRSTRKK